MAETITHAPKLPPRSHVYQNHHFDSTRWNFVALRDDDIVVATPYKGGSTWMLTLLAI